MYALFHDEKNLSDTTVAALYATVYLSAAVASPFSGFLADRFGRRAAGLAFCILHSAASLTVISSSLAVIYLGRVLAGIALTLLWTVFESWMVTEYAARGLAGSSMRLTSLFGVMIASNCMAAIVGGVVAHCIVLALGSWSHPVLLGVVLEVAASCQILRTWVSTSLSSWGFKLMGGNVENENHGMKHSEHDEERDVRMYPQRVSSEPGSLSGEYLDHDCASR
jgi:MFS transporter, MFS domain-containing protein family, molybdate-anion transporter